MLLTDLHPLNLNCCLQFQNLHSHYKQPAVLDDALVVTCEMHEYKGATATMYQEIRRGETILATIEVKAAYVNLTKKRPVRIPEDLINRFEKL